MFGKYFPAYLKKTEGHFSPHDATYWLPHNLSEEKNNSLAIFLQNNIIYVDNHGKTKAREVSDLDIIAKNWYSLKKEEEKLKFKDMLALCQSRKYSDQSFDNFAVEAAKWGVSEKEYKSLEDFYKAGLKTPTPFATDKEFKSENIVGRFLPRDDVRVGFFGGYTACCQHFGGIGKDCAVSSVMDPYSQLFVLEREGKIIAGSWVWVNEIKENNKEYKTACFDNIEAIGEWKRSHKLNDIYNQAAKYLTAEQGYRKVTIGVGYQDADIGDYKSTEAIPLPEHYGSRYSDAKSQVLLAENTNAPALEPNHESLRFVRDAINFDINEMMDVSKECFPEGSKGLEIPEDMSGFALVDEKKGVVGYIMYDETEKHIYDMAVLPKYRTDKNASSKKLLAEMTKHIRNVGGEWKGEFRENTTLRYMKSMQERGIINLEIGNVDQVMSDGTKTYEVKFSVAETNNKQQHVKPKPLLAILKRFNLFR